MQATVPVEYENKIYYHHVFASARRTSKERNPQNTVAFPKAKQHALIQQGGNCLERKQTKTILSYITVWIKLNITPSILLFLLNNTAALKLKTIEDGYKKFSVVTVGA